MLTVHQQIVKSVGAHGMWKSRLQKAIETGASDLSVTVVRQDDQCDFGKWLLGRDVSDEIKRSAHYTECQRLHRQFHLEASKVLTLAISGRKAEALRAVEPNSEFAKCSANLTKTMMAWDAEAQRVPSSGTGHR